MSSPFSRTPNSHALISVELWSNGSRGRDLRRKEKDDKMIAEDPSLQLSPRTKSRLQETFAKSRSSDEHITLEWANVNYHVITADSKKGSKSGKKNNRILRDVSGRAESGQLVSLWTMCQGTTLLTPSHKHPTH